MNRSKISPLAAIALLGLGCFVLAVVVAGAVTAGYSPTQEYISALSSRTNPHAWIMMTGFACLAGATVAAALAVHQRVGGRSGGVGCILLGLAGLGLVGSAAFRLDCSPTLESCAALEAAGTVSGHHVLHNLVSLLSHLLLVTALLVLSRALRTSSGLTRLSGPTMVVGMVTLAFIIGLVVTGYGQFGGTVQRVVVLSAYGWPVWLALAPVQPARRRVGAEPRAVAHQ